ncbi:hypothetical protein DOTSEDRAFT_75374 [Dothistroma septosporum NZE10]|uniref:Uncharacterized protein n=1 Tax=Dothistroma septosporum (strain NZE10 / CBS 128990) TaxID=675120 RepID=M2XJR7_DOTSN|nr:hypothetical protein DOTSEDRAFT_75374 [Dothistroma septosporum NZE10]
MCPAAFHWQMLSLHLRALRNMPTLITFLRGKSSTRCYTVCWYGVLSLALHRSGGRFALQRSAEASAVSGCYLQHAWRSSTPRTSRYSRHVQRLPAVDDGTPALYESSAARVPRVASIRCFGFLAGEHSWLGSTVLRPRHHGSPSRWHRAGDIRAPSLVTNFLEQDPDSCHSLRTEGVTSMLAVRN